MCTLCGTDALSLVFGPASLVCVHVCVCVCVCHVCLLCMCVCMSRMCNTVNREIFVLKNVHAIIFRAKIIIFVREQAI